MNESSLPRSTAYLRSLAWVALFVPLGALLLHLVAFAFWRQSSLARAVCVLSGFTFVWTVFPGFAAEAFVFCRRVQPRWLAMLGLCSNAAGIALVFWFGRPLR